MPGNLPLSVLIASADGGRRSALGQTLRKAGNTVRDAASGAEALRSVAEQPDVILLDLPLPDMGGFEVCGRLKSHAATAGIPVLHLSDAPVECNALAAHLEQGDDAFLTHPVAAAALLSTVKTLVRGRQAQRQLSSFLEAAPDAVVIADGDGRIVRVNGQTEKMFGYGREELVGQEVEILIPERFRATHRGRRAGFVARPSTRPMGGPSAQLWGLRKDGSEFAAEISLGPLPSHQGILVASIIRDVTERRRLEQALRDADRRKDEFLATLAHELRNPLAPVRYAVQVLRMKGPAGPEAQRATEVIDRQVRSMTRLIDDLLDVSRISRNKLDLRTERVELATVVREAVETSRPLIEQHGHVLAVTLPTHPVLLDGDPTRLAQMFSNLLTNAAKYTEAGGRVDLRAERQGSDVVVAVRDTGIGIAADHLPAVFEMFAQVAGAVSRSEGGLGIGLCLVKRLVEMHGGSVEARSEGLGKGSEFVVRLPAALVQRHVPAADADEATPTSDLRILVVDDSRDAASTLATLLEMTGNDVRTAHDGREAVRAADEFRPHVVLLDIGLPKMNGYDACRAIRREAWGEAMVLIAMTGWGQDDDRRKSEEAGFDRHLVKPVDPQSLMKLLAGLEAVKA